MCGIIGYFGSKPTKVRNLLDIAYWNIHRGDDGIGIIIPSDETKSGVKMWKLGYRLEEVITNTLGKDRAVKFIKIGSIGMNSLDEERYIELNREFSSYSKSINNTISNSIFLHHRKASISGTDSRNIHPVVIGNNYFFHNGTSYQAIFLRSYQEIFENEKFMSETDSEVISKTYLRLLEKWSNPKKILKGLINIFGSIGVIIRINAVDDIIEILKDETRPLWFAELNSGTKILMSEPTPHIAKHLIKLYKLDVGIIKPGDVIKVKDYTEDYKEAYEIWQDDLADNDVKTMECDCCKENKIVRRFTSLDKYVDNVAHDRCFVCTVEKKERKSNEFHGDDKEWKEIVFPELSFA